MATAAQVGVWAGNAVPIGSSAAPRAMPGGAVLGPLGLITLATALAEADRSRAWRQVDAAIARFGLDSGSAADVLAAHAYVWGKNMSSLQFEWGVPWSGEANEAAAQAIMRLERRRPGTLRAAQTGDLASHRMLASAAYAAAGEFAGPAPALERTSSVDRALSTYSRAARAAAANPIPQRWIAHHLLPFAVVAALPRARQLAMVQAGFRMDSPANIIPLPADLQSYVAGLTGPVHSSAHPVYSADAAMLLAPVAATTGASLTAGISGLQNSLRALLLLVTTVSFTQPGRPWHARLP